MQRPRVLAVDDSRTQLLVLADHLERSGYDVATAGDGAQALAAVDRERFDLVVSDVVMPNVDGYGLCRGVKERDPALPVLLLTSLTDPVEIVRALQAGADMFLRKPYQPDDLLERVRTMLDTRADRPVVPATGSIDVVVRGERLSVDPGRGQVLDLLVSTFDDLVTANRQLLEREAELDGAHRRLSDQLVLTERERDRLLAVLQAIPEGLAVVDADGVIVEANERLARLTGAPIEELRDHAFADALAFADHAGVSLSVGSRLIARSLAAGEADTLGTAFDLFVVRRDGTLVPTIAHAAPVRTRSGGVQGAVGVLENITPLVAHDPVTGLPGHQVLVERLGAAIDPSDRHARPTAVLVVTLDRFDRIRTSTAPSTVDLVRTIVFDRLRTALDEDFRRRGVDAFAAQVAPTEAAVLVHDVDDVEHALLLAELLLEQVARPMTVDGLDLTVTATIAAHVAEVGSDPAATIGAVAAAARDASERGGERVVTTDPALHEHVRDRLVLEHELRRAIGERALTVHYQPQVRVSDGRPVAVEALVRWEHPERGLLAPSDILPLATESGLMGALSWMVLEDAARQAAAWRAQLPGAEHLVLAANLTAEQLAEADVVEHVERVLADTGLDPSGLVLEITEASVMSGHADSAERLLAIKALGVQFSIDDFGTGSSSLLRLRDVPADAIKVDRSFIARMTTEAADAAIVAGTVRLARALGLEVIAEGVETADQLVQLRVLGCDVAQGNLWSPPMAAEELGAWWPSDGGDAGTALRLPTPELVPAADDDDVIAILVHELRSPLAAIIGFAELLEMDDIDPEMVQPIIRSAYEIERRLASINDARDALQGKMLQLDRSAEGVAGFVRMLAADLTPQLAPHPVDVRAETDVIAPIDRGRLAQAVTNLLTNAAKFSPGDTPIELAVEATSDAVVIRIRDHGPGVPEHRRPELFRRFSRLGSRKKGMGIGLFLTRLIVEAHGGSVRHEPPPDGDGSAFVIQLPRS